MTSFRIVLVEPQTDGNVGAVARSMGNFGFERLFMANPCELTEEAFKRAKHGNYLLSGATTVTSFEEAIAGCFLVVGTSGIITYGDKHFIRIPITPRELAERIRDQEDEVALVFGREDIGLTQEQLTRCDILVNIPSNEEYPILNLSHAATIVMYEIFASHGKPSNPKKATEFEKDKLYQFFDALLDAVDYPEHRREKTSIMFRRMMGRAIPTSWEFHTIMGVIGDAAKKIKRLEKNEEGK
jgi:TrmH family RNA methyltransferase